MNSISLSSPAKINLFLAVTGRRADGFHDLVSLVSLLAWGDELEVVPAPGFSLECDNPAVPTGDDNLVLKAARAFRKATGWNGGARFRLTKRIPMGAGLGGGSSNAAAALLALNELAGSLLTIEALGPVAAQVGSDCPLFLHKSALIMRGRGELIEPLNVSTSARLRGLKVLLFKPSFSVSTPWAYAQLAESSEGRGGLRPKRLARSATRSVAEAAEVYPPLAAPKATRASDPETRLADGLRADRPIEALLFNSLEAPVFRKYPALPVLLANLRRDFGLAGAMSGSGSCCFALLPDAMPPARVQAAVSAIRDAFGRTAFILETSLA